MRRLPLDGLGTLVLGSSTAADPATGPFSTEAGEVTGFAVRPICRRCGRDPPERAKSNRNE